MLEVSRHKQIHNVLKGKTSLSLLYSLSFSLNSHDKPLYPRYSDLTQCFLASILCKQEEVAGNEFASNVYKFIKTEYHTKVQGNYHKSH